MSWSQVVATPEQARAALAEPGDALDLRAPDDGDPAWVALGFTVLAPGELVRPVEVALADLAATQALGARLAVVLRAGDLVVLSGPLGAGKTSLTQGVGRALGVRGAVTSPTFVLARRHTGPLALVHVDLYRLRGVGRQVVDLDDLDLDDELPHVVTVVEWGEGLVEDLSPDRLHVELAHAAWGELTPGLVSDRRTARVRAVGQRWSVL